MAFSKVILNDEVLMDVTDDTVAGSNLLSGEQATGNDGEKVEGTIATKTSSDLTASGATVTVPAGYYASQATKTVSTTTHPDPTISVNSSTGLVTASHTQSTGYVTGGTTTSTLSLTTVAAKTVTPTEYEQTAVTADRYTTGIVKVGAISSTYVGSDIAQNDSDDLTASGATVTVPAGYYAEDASKTVASGSSTVSSTITISPTITVSDAGLITAKTNGSVGVKPTVTAGYISEGTTGTITYTGNSTTQLATQAAKTVTPTESSQTAVAAKRYTTGAVTVAAIPSTYVGSGITQRDSDDLTASGATVSVPAGYYSTAASKTIDSGSATIPANTAIIANDVTQNFNVNYSTGVIGYTSSGTKRITPSVTPGYISSGTAGDVAIAINGSSNITLQTKSVTPSGLEQAIIPYENGGYAGALNYVAYCNSGSISHNINLVNGTTYIINSTITLTSDGDTETYDSVNYNSIVTWDGSWSPQNLPKGTASNYVKSLVLDSTTLTPVWYSSSDFSVQCHFYFSAFELRQSDAFLSQVTVNPIPRLADLVSLLNSYQIVNADADMGEVYCSLEAFFSAIESGGYNFGVSLLESAGSNLLTDDAETLYGDRTIQKVSNGGGSYTINYQ